MFLPSNELRAEGKNRSKAIIEAVTIRLRPILMTTAAMVLGSCRWSLRAARAWCPATIWGS
nr:hypothetical protein BDOA9_0205930 [Bradyrhizobium sp. DOA9]